MEEEQQKIKDHFAKHLKAADYVAEMSECWKDAPELFRFMIEFIHNAFSSGKFQGSKLLEIGSGVLVHSIASASRFFPNIVMSDYVENNLEELRKWLKGQSSIRQFLEVQAELEGYGNDLATGIKNIESRIRKNVKRVTRCDVTKDGILVEKDSNPETSPPYDVVVSCLCLEVCPVDVKGYGDIMKRINSLIKPGGGLLLAGFYHGSTWIAGGHSFPHIKIDQQDLLDAVTNAGFGDIEIKSMGKDNANDVETGIKIIESRIRKSVKRVTRCDVTQDGILLEKDNNAETSPPYDIIVSCLCLEVCPVDVKGYKDIMKRISALIKPGGGLLLTGFYQGSTWATGGHMFHHVKIDQSDLLDALTNAGFADIEIKTMGKEGSKFSNNFMYSKLFCLIAKKLNDVKA